MPSVYCLGSLNLDFVYQVQAIVRPGETITALSSDTHFGGKGANQSIALARAGASVRHIGLIGPDGEGLKANLKASGVDVSFVQKSTTRSGSAIIQVQRSGENSIIVEAGANGQITEQLLVSALDKAQVGDWLLTQNETNLVEWAVCYAKSRGLKIAYNPSPFHAEIATAILTKIDLIILNETEGYQLTNEPNAEDILMAIHRRAPTLETVLTLGERGSFYQAGGSPIFEAAVSVTPVDTTGAGDTFLGYFIGSRIRGLDACEALGVAARAASICVTRPGAAASIPFLHELTIE